jgi:hypothetical protein
MLRRRFTVHLIAPASPALVSDEKVPFGLLRLLMAECDGIARTELSHRT